MPVRISYGMAPAVPARAAADSGLAGSASMSVTSRPGAASGTSVRSTRTMSMQTAPTTGASRPPTRTCARFESARGYPSA